MEPENQPPGDPGDPFWNTIMNQVFFVFFGKGVSETFASALTSGRIVGASWVGGIPK